MATNPLKKQFQNFPVPRLDDRSFQELMDEMRSLIPIYCPEWTNHNPSDPGITLLELFAFLSEIMLYRLNRVPVRNLFSLLDVLGIQPQAPSAARTPIVVGPNPTAHGYVLKRGTAIGARRSGSGEPLLFETEHDLLLTTARITRVITSNGLETRDVTDLITAPEPMPISPFAGVQAIERYMYLCDGRFLTLREQGMRVHIIFQGRSAVRDLYARWRWEYYNGESWSAARLAVGHGKGEVILDTIPDLAEVAINGYTGPWLRALPLPAEGEPSDLTFEEIEVEVESVEEGVMPDAVFLNPGGETVFTNLDLTRVFYPLGENPRRESACYIMARELFRAAGTRVELSMVTPDGDVYPRPDPSTDLALRIEYPIPGNRWGLIRSITPNPFIQPGENKFKLEDNTRALRRGGIISFVVPDDMQTRDIQGVVGPWIRIRLNTGEYREPQSTEPDQIEERYGQPNPPVGPAFEALLIRSKAPAAPIQRAISYSDFTFMELWDAVKTRGTPVQLFPVREQYTRALYLAFSLPFPQGQNRIYFKIRDDGEAYEESWEQDIAMQRVKWELATRSGFIPLPQAEDDTLHLKRDGYLTFSGPFEPEKAALFEESAYWIRARLVEGRYDVAPMIEDIRLNAVDALHVNTQIENRIEPSDGQAYQEFKLLRAPVLGNVMVWVLDKESPSGDVRARILQELGPDALLDDTDGTWCRWTAVDHFFRCGPDSRSFRLDALNGVIQFGDGIRGKIPPPGPRVIRIESYWTGGGNRGNVGPHTLTVLKEGNSQIASVDNPFPADGGTEQEDLSDAAQRGTRQMFTVDRAYRAEDFETLARQASRRVAKVMCLAPRPTERKAGRRGEPLLDMGDESRVRIVIIPHQPFNEQTMRDRLVPSQELIRRVERYLEERRTLNTRISVRGPRYVPFSVACVVYLRGKLSTGVEEDVERRLYNYLHPLVGGEDGRGWELGQSVRRVSLFQVVSGSPQILSVLDLRMLDRNGQTIDGSLNLRDDQLPFLMRVKLETAVLK